MVVVFCFLFLIIALSVLRSSAFFCWALLLAYWWTSFPASFPVVELNLVIFKSQFAWHVYHSNPFSIQELHTVIDSDFTLLKTFAKTEIYTIYIKTDIPTALTFIARLRKIRIYAKYKQLNFIIYFYFHLKASHLFWTPYQILPVWISKKFLLLVCPNCVEQPTCKLKTKYSTLDRRWCHW